MSRLQTAVNTMLGRKPAGETISPPQTTEAPTGLPTPQTRAVPAAMVSPWEKTYTVRMIVTVAVPASSREHALAVARSSFHTLRATVVSAQDAEVQG